MVKGKEYKYPYQERPPERIYQTMMRRIVDGISADRDTMNDMRESATELMMHHIQLIQFSRTQNDLLRRSLALLEEVVEHTPSMPQHWNERLLAILEELK